MGAVSVIVMYVAEATRTGESPVGVESWIEGRGD
jgi:hypothetical protein